MSYMDDLKNIVSKQGKDPRKTMNHEVETPQPEILNEKGSMPGKKTTEETEEEEVKDLNEK